MIGDFNEKFIVKLMQLKVMPCCQSRIRILRVKSFLGSDPYQAADPTPKVGKQKKLS